MDNSLMFSSENQAWATRTNTFRSIEEQLNREYNLDPCCVPETAKCNRYITPEIDMLSVVDPFTLFQEKQFQVFMNPPYGREQKAFVSHAVNWCNNNSNIVVDVLIPARTDTALYHDIILPNATAIRFVKGRVIFGTDEYWEDLWGKEYLDNGKRNSLFGKQGKMTAAPFPSMVVSFGGEKTGELYSTLVLPKERYVTK